MNLSKNIKPISYLKANAAQVALELKETGQAMIITQNGEATMVVQSVAEYERMQETLALLKMLAQSQQAVSSGKTVSSADAFSRLKNLIGLFMKHLPIKLWCMQYSMDGAICKVYSCGVFYEAENHPAFGN
jgi:prevent-host-death family protein